ncbi:hypothetical protein AB0C34_23830 [Nocardia sp. NPDC049220]|uniref:hypothetical protein n=1 Tax=Nocardia sp. NPDC049220 TaxID=3155273 RepID=UPI0033F5B153
MTASHAVCNEVLRSERIAAASTFAVRLKPTPPTRQRDDVLVHPLDDSSANPPEHTSLRRIVAPRFSPQHTRPNPP